MDTRHGASPTIAAAALANKPLVFSKMESLVREMQIPDTGIPIGDQKIFLTSIPSVFMGYDLVEWLMDRLEIEDSAEAIHLANLMCQYGYFFPVGEPRSLIVKDDSSLYRFQTPYYWPSQNHSADTTDYAIYLTKRLSRNKQKHGLEEYEMEAYGNLKKGLQHKWDFVLMQSDEQVRLAKDRKKGDKIVTDSQERAYWRVYRPPPGYTNSLENAPIPDRNNMANRVKKKTIDICKQEIGLTEKQIQRTRIKVSVIAEGLITHTETYSDYEYFLNTPQPSNPWLTDDLTYWMLNENLVEVATEKRVKRWAISFAELVSDPTGLNEFTNYLRKEYSHENIRFWQAVVDLRYGLASEVVDKVKRVYEEFLKPGAPCEINIDGKTMEVTQQMMKTPSRYTYDLAADHVYMLLLKKDCYPRFLRSEYYKNLQANAAQPLQKKRFFSFGGPGKKKITALPNSACLQAQTPQPLKRHGSDEQNAAQGSFSGPEPHMGIGAALGVFQPKVDCDPPYRGDLASVKLAQTSELSSSTDRSGGSGSQNEPGTGICPWETTDNVCPWDSASTPQPPEKQPRQPQQPLQQQQTRQSQQPTLPTPLQMQQPLQISLPQKPQQTIKVRPDRSKSMEVHSPGSQRPQSASFVPSLGPIKGNSSPSDAGSPVRSEKAMSVDTCSRQNQQSSKAVASSITSPKESILSSLAPITGGPYLLTERRASEGVLRMALGVCPWDGVLSVTQKSKKKDETQKEVEKGNKEKTSIKIKVVSSDDENVPEVIKSSKPSKNVAPKSVKGHVATGSLKIKSDKTRCPTSPKIVEAPKGKAHKECTALVPYQDSQKDKVELVDAPTCSEGEEQRGVIPTDAATSEEFASPGKTSNVLATTEDDSSSKKPGDVCPWEDDSLTPTWL